MTDQDKRATAAYRRNGALLALKPEDAFWLIASGGGEFEPDFDSGQEIGVSVSGSQVDSMVCGEPPRLYLTGRVEITRGEPDEITDVSPVDINGLFE